MLFILNLTIAIALFMLAVTPVSAQYLKDPPAFTAETPADGIKVYPPVAINGQWVDAYYAGNVNGGDRSETEIRPSCVVVYYHGGGFRWGTPRDIAGSELLMLAAAVRNSGCIFMIPSYPTNTGGDVQFSISTILGDVDRVGSVFGSFNYLYNQYIRAWKQSNPKFQVWTAGTSAGAILAQRVAVSGHWPIAGTFLIAPPVKNPQYFGHETESTGVFIRDPLDGSCESRMRNASDCSNARALFEIESDKEWTSRAASNDLSFYALTTPANLHTHVVINACDDVADLGSFMRGYFNFLNPARRSISIWKGFSKEEIGLMAGERDASSQAHKGAQHAFYQPILEAYMGISPADGKWAVYNQATADSIGGRYVDYCDAGDDTHHFRSNLIN